MQVWRIGYNGALQLHLLDQGSLLADGRWHVASSRLSIVYSGSSRALCQLEKRVHCNGSPPARQALMRLELPDTAPLGNVEDIGLPANWRNDVAATQRIGTDWAAGGNSLGLWVPSYVEPAERNLVLNPRHPDYQAITVVIEQNPFQFDPRLFT